MIKVTILFVLLTILKLSYAGVDTSNVIVKRAEHGFILRSCQASVQLNRKYRTNPETNALKSKSAQSADYPKMLNENIAKRFKFGDRNPVYGRTNLKTRETRQEKEVSENTPFRTIDVKPVNQNRPQAFKIQDLLPQLSRTSSGKKLKTEPKIYIVENLHSRE